MASTMTALRISEVSERTGFSGPTLRYYEQIGLLPAPDRTAGGPPSDLGEMKHPQSRLSACVGIQSFVPPAPR